MGSICDPKIEYQHFYTESKEPRVTVCYLRFPLHTAVGIAICSWKDNPCKKVGRKIALQRAQTAGEFGDTTLPLLRTDAQQVIQATDFILLIDCKSFMINRADARFSRKYWGSRVEELQQ